MGTTASQSANAFIVQHARVLGVDAASLAPAEPFVQPLVYLPNEGTYRFTSFRYRQHLGGIPVFGTDLRLLVRNEPGFPLVLASANLRATDGFANDPQLLAQPPRTAEGLERAQDLSRTPGVSRVLSSRRVVWAGADPSSPEAPRLADETIVAVGQDKWLVLTDASTGAVLFERTRVHLADLAGTAEGFASQGAASDNCEVELAMGLPYLHVNVGSQLATTDVDGNFLVRVDETGPVQVSATLQGDWFAIQSAAGSNGSASTVVTPPEQAAILFNPGNASEFRRAEVNAYLHANRIRDYILQFNPAYPTLNDGGFQVKVNRSDFFCPGNAWYDAADRTLNFCRSGEGLPNTAFASVVYHEYGHHLVEAAGSGQEEYGEGMGDVMSLLVLDAPELGLGFLGNCNAPLRTADNNCQFSATTCSTNCGSEIHACGRVLSGAVWSVRNELASAYPASYREILSSLAINSTLLHTGDAIDGDIVTDFLVLDDDDATLCNGTPHAAQIQAGFAAHGLLDNSFSLALAPNMPEFVSPDGDTPVQLSVCGSLPPVAGGVRLMVFAPEVGGYLFKVMDEVAPGLYETTFPARPCGAPAPYFFEASFPGGLTARLPLDSPNDTFLAFAGSSMTPLLGDSFESDLGWTVSSDASLTSGAWERALPTPLSMCGNGNPGLDADGSGHAFVTGNGPVPCPSDVDGGTTTVTSPQLDLSGPGMPVLVYSRWFSTATGPNPFQDLFVVQVSANGGATWLPLETVGFLGLQSSGGWIQRSYALGGLVGATAQFRVRFRAGDLGSDSTVEAAIDDVRVVMVQCGTRTVPEDLNGDGTVNGADLGILLAAWGPANGSNADLNDDGEVNGADLGMLLAMWGTARQ